jgi:hypothetical protein
VSTSRSVLLRKPFISAAVLVVGAGILAATTHGADASPDVVTSALSIAGKTFTVTNHLVRAPQATPPGQAGHRPHEWLLVWAGDANVADTTGGDIKNLPLAVNPGGLTKGVSDALPGPDFLAVIDADKSSPSYGKVVNTATVGPLVENEPHHMQYVFHKGDKIFAGGLFSDTTYVFDANRLPLLSLSGVNLPTDTLCGSVPDAFWVLKDHTAYGTYMGGPDLPGPCVYTNGQIRVGNGFGGSPGEIVHMGSDGRTLSEAPAALATSEDRARCVDIPILPSATCANPHGIQLREDLNRMVASDYAEPRNIILDPVKPLHANLFRDTVRIFDISRREAGVARGVRRHSGGTAGRPEHPRRCRLRRCRLAADEPGRPLPLPRGHRPRTGQRSARPLAEDGLHARHQQAACRGHGNDLQHRPDQ